MAVIVNNATVNQDILNNQFEQVTVEDALNFPEKILMQPYNHVLGCGGKKIRTKLIQAFNFWLKVPDDYIKLLQKSIELLHNASLLMDDIEDYSTLRRGLPAAHIVYGIPLTVSSANYVLAKTIIELVDQASDEKKYESTVIIMEQLILLHQGQGIEIHWRDSQICPTLDEYLDMIDKKTTGLFGLSLRLMQLIDDNKQDFLPLIKLIGQYFQIRDDYANLKFDEYANQKSFAEDLTEGKFSFPIVHAITSYPEDYTILNILKLRTSNNTIKRFAIRHLEKLGSLAYTAQFLKKLKNRIFLMLNRLPNNPHLVEVMNLLYLEENEASENQQTSKEEKEQTKKNDEQTFVNNSKTIDKQLLTTSSVSNSDKITSKTESTEKYDFNNNELDTKDKPFYFFFPIIY